MWIIILTVGAVLLLYLKIANAYKFWQEKGVPYVKPFLIFGNLAPNLFRKRAFANLLEDMYGLYPNDRYIGVFHFLQPVLMIRDPDLIKQITVKDFDAFPDHSLFVTGEADTLFNRNLFSMKNKDGWHNMRATLTPSFTSSKMKLMFTLIQHCSTQFVNYFKNEGGTVTLELKDAFTRFTNDVIGTTAFGVTCDSLRDKDNEFYVMGKDATNFSGVRLLKIFGYVAIPSIMNLFKVKFLSQEVSSFFVNLIKETLRIRQEQHIVRPDMINLLMETRNGRLTSDHHNAVVDSGFAVAQESEIVKTHKSKKIPISDDDIVAQALVFFIAGFETASTLMSYTAYELAVNPDVQEKLCREIDDVVEQYKGQITYEGLLGMKYLDNVISESLRRHPPSQLTDRISVAPYTIQPERPEEKALHLDQGMSIWIPIYAIHTDPNNYPDPERFNPERFNDENRHSIKPFTFLPFGVGPRNCIGSRFALLETKLIIVELLRSFQFVMVEKTQVSIQLSKSNPSPLPDEGLWIGLKPR